MYVIKRTDQGGGFVAKLGSADSYTRNLRRAWIFATREKALETVSPIINLLPQPRRYDHETNCD